MVAQNNHRVLSRPRKNVPSGNAGERLELLRLRDSTDPVARVLALCASQLLRFMDGLQREAEP